MENATEIYVYLLDEGTDAWRPVQAVHVGGDVYRIVSTNTDPEKWEFSFNKLVHCKERKSIEGESFLTAYRQA